MAVGRASAAFNDGEMEVSKKLADFASDACPHIMRSLGWMETRLQMANGPQSVARSAAGCRWDS